MREKHGLRHRDAARLGDDVVEELVVAAPPERVVNDLRAGRRGLLEVGPVERDLMADTVEDDVVVRGDVLAERADRDRLGNEIGRASCRERV